MDLETVLSGKNVEGRATDLLREDHRKLQELFNECSQAIHEQWNTRQTLVEQLCIQLELHARIEEEVFYPAVRRLNREFVSRALQDHATVARDIAVLKGHSPADAGYDARVIGLIRATEHHIADEESQFVQLDGALSGEQARLQADMIKLKETLVGSAEEIEGRS
jgi:hypothetical protein